VNWNQNRKKKKKRKVQQKTFRNGLGNTDIFAKFYSKMRKVILALFASAILSGCAKNSSSMTCNYDPCSLKASAGEITQLETYLSGAGITTAIKHCSGMYYEIKNPGTGVTPTTCSYVSVNYKGMLTNGTVFDQTTSSPAAFTLVTLIEGWKKGIPLIKRGGSITLYIPPSLGYGPSANGSIPGNSILIFDIQLIDVQ
jgi:FKBP-type peptidyl-prolyl cis-trans isomerase FkpA